MQDIDKNTVLNINLKSIKNNYRKIKKKVNSNCIVAATVKANAYGLGIKKIVPILYKSGCRYFFVATTNEALEVRKVNKSISIFILNGLVTSDLSIIHKYNLIPIINNLRCKPNYLLTFLLTSHFTSCETNYLLTFLLTT